MMDDLSVSNLQYATALIGAGYQVFPCCWPTDEGLCGCGRGHNLKEVGKAPLTLHAHLDASAKAADVFNWWTQYPLANISIKLDGFLMVDPDSDEAQTEVAAWDLPPTIIRYSRQQALIFRVPEDFPRTRLTKKGHSREIDLLTNGYCLVGGTHKDQMPLKLDSLNEPAMAPDSLLAKVREWMPLSLPTLTEQLDHSGDPPIRLGREGMEWWTGVKAHQGANGVVDRSETLFRLGGILQRAGATEQTIIDALTERDATLYGKFTDRKDSPIRYAEIARKVCTTSSAAVYAPPPPSVNGHQNGTVPSILVGMETFANTDLGNAERLVSMFGDDLRHSSAIGWLIWEDTHWQRDVGEGSVHRLTFRMIRSMYQRGKELITELEQSIPGDDGQQNGPQRDRDSIQKQAEALIKWAKVSETRSRIEGLIDEAQHMVQISPLMLDADDWVLNVSNGTIDLKTGELRPHVKADLLTHFSPVAYDPTASYEGWDTFIERILPDIERREFVQRAAGYSLTGSVEEEKLLFPYGPTGTGKSTFFRAIASVMGDYSCTSSFESFLEKKTPGGIPNDIARLAGKRMVTSIEVESGQKMAEGLVKQITGGDVISARFLHKEWFEFVPKFKLWLAANHRPRVKDDDDAIWRRIVQIPFDVQIPASERDDSLKNVLTDIEIAGPAILKWMVDGCLTWQQIGLAIPAGVKAATDDYRMEMDPLTDFLDECCVMIPNAITGNADLYGSYKSWAGEAGHRFPLGRKAFTQRMEANPLVEHEKHNKRRWFGIGIVSDTDFS